MDTGKGRNGIGGTNGANGKNGAAPAGDNGRSSGTTFRSIASSAQPVVRVDRVDKRIHGVHALRNVSLTVRQGEVFGLLGPAGAGKSTLARILMGFLHPDSGTVRLFGLEDLSRTHDRVGYLPQKPHYNGNFTGRDYLAFHAGLTGLSGRDARQVADRLLETVGLGATLGKRRIGSYSKENLQRFGLAVALASGGAEPPDLLILDDPSSGLDTDGQIEFRQIVTDCQRRGSTVLICTHLLTDVERACTAAGVLRAGRLLAQTHLDESPRVSLVGVPRPGAAEILPYLTDYLHRLHPTVAVRGGQAEGEPLHVSLPTGPDFPQAAPMKAAALRAMLDARWDIVSVYVESKDLESVYALAVQATERKAEPSEEGEAEAEAETATEQEAGTEGAEEVAAVAATRRHTAPLGAAPQPAAAVAERAPEPELARETAAPEAAKVEAPVAESAGGPVTAPLSALQGPPPGYLGEYTYEQDRAGSREESASPPSGVPAPAPNLESTSNEEKE